MSLILDLCYLVFFTLSSPWWARKARGGWRERFGGIDPLPAPARRRVLLHAVSVGEVNTLRRLAPMLAREFDVVVSSTTDTGLARARELFGALEAATVVRYPLDFSWSVRKFLEAVRPDAVVLTELELWPNFLRACRTRGIPVAVVNGRLSERSFRTYRLARPLIGWMFRQLASVGAQDEAYAQRFRRMGAPPERVRVTGSMKWDSVEVADRVEGADELARSLGVDRERPLIVAGSTAPDEHTLLHEATPPGVQLLCAPRRPEWFDGAERDLPGCARRTRPGAAPTSDRFLLDTIGELRAAYALADVVVVGRSFGSLFGSDPMEPAALGKPVLIGPAAQDFRSAVETLLAAGGIVVTSRERLSDDIRRLLANSSQRAELGKAARACVAACRGATERHADQIRASLPENPDESVRAISG